VLERGKRVRELVAERTSDPDMSGKVTDILMKLLLDARHYYAHEREIEEKEFEERELKKKEKLKNKVRPQ
jgi:hypothetical protein